MTTRSWTADKLWTVDATPGFPLIKDGDRVVAQLSECYTDRSDREAALLAAAPAFAIAAFTTIAYYAATEPGAVCLNDHLNPCGGPGAPGTLKHWGGGSACPLCAARAAQDAFLGGAK